MHKIIFTGMVLIAAIFSGCTSTIDTFATLYGVVSDKETGEPISGASVTLTPGGGNKTTGSDGYYEFTNLEPRQYTIQVTANGYKTDHGTITAVAGERQPKDFKLTKNN